MEIVKQRTLKNRISCTGVGLHSGARVRMALLPADCDTGIVFRRSDLAGGGALVPAHIRYVSESALCTALANEDGITVSTVEHLMAALAGCDIDNAVIELDSPEVPIMDGSAAPFVFLIECAGTVEQEAPRRAIEVCKPVEVRDGERMASLAPADAFIIGFEIDFESPAVACQRCEFVLGNGTFKSELSRARTFGFIHEVEELRALGLARGGSLENAVVISGDRVLNEGGLRYEDEFVRHKALDSMGDLYLAGAPFLGRFFGVRSGHALNHALVRALLEDRGAWRYTTLPAERETSAPYRWAGAAASA